MEAYVGNLNKATSFFHVQDVQPAVCVYNRWIGLVDWITRLTLQITNSSSNVVAQIQDPALLDTLKTKVKLLTARELPLTLPDDLYNLQCSHAFLQCLQSSHTPFYILTMIVCLYSIVHFSLIALLIGWIVELIWIS